jgi:hypothetical protein
VQVTAFGEHYTLAGSLITKQAAMITHKSASAANLSMKVRRYQTFEVSQTSKVYTDAALARYGCKPP